MDLPLSAILFNVAVNTDKWGICNHLSIATVRLSVIVGTVAFVLVARSIGKLIMALVAFFTPVDTRVVYRDLFGGNREIQG